MKVNHFKSILIPIMAPALAAMAFAGCDSGSSGSAAQATVAPQTASESSNPEPSPAPSPSASPSSSVIGDSCVSSDANKTCLAVHFVTYKDSSGTPVASTDQAIKIIRTMNQLWSQCNIGFEIEKYDAVDPTPSGLSYGAQSQNELNQIRDTYSQPSNELLGVTTGPWGTAVNAWTNMPGDGVYGAIMEASIVDYGGGIIYAHEFGHYLGLDHVSDTSNLMNPIIYTTSSALTSSLCQTAQDTAKSYWSAMIRN
jgi:hypothetical protein